MIIFQLELQSSIVLLPTFQSPPTENNISLSVTFPIKITETENQAHFLRNSWQTTDIRYLTDSVLQY